MSEPRPFFVHIPPTHKGARLDKALAALLPAHSRATIQRWLKQGAAFVDGEPGQQTQRLRGGERVYISPPPTPLADWPAQAVPFDIIHADAHILVINKPAGVVVHPGAGHAEHTLLNGLLHIAPELRALPRAGIVHRLDKGTTGLMVVARSEIARQRLIAQLQDRSMRRGYVAAAHGVLIAGERIDQPIARHAYHRTRMCVAAHGKPAATHIRVVQKFRHHCVIRAQLETGRTHQIRVHLSWRGFPLIGDKSYGGGHKHPPAASPALRAALSAFPRQALHAEHLELRHPISAALVQWQQPPPPDFVQLLAELAAD